MSSAHIDNKKKTYQFSEQDQRKDQNIKDWSADNMKKTRFNGYVYDFSVDYGAIAADDIKDIHTFLMKNNNIVQYV